MENVHLIYESMGIRISHLTADAYISEWGWDMEKENLIEYLRRKTGIPFLSDLRDPQYFSHIRQALTRTELNKFDLNDWNEAIRYITRKNKEFADKEQALCTGKQ